MRCNTSPVYRGTASTPVGCTFRDLTWSAVWLRRGGTDSNGVDLRHHAGRSQFRPAVLSPAEAVGLMQIIPPTARLIVQTAKKTKLDPEALDDPDHNIAMGAWYLAGLSERYSHQFPQVMAAYNAGPKRRRSMGSSGWAIPDGSGYVYGRGAV